MSGFGGYKSHSTAFVSCCLALILCALPQYKVATNGGETTIVKFKQVLMDTALKLDDQSAPHDDQYGYGLIRAYDACAALAA